MRRLNVHGLRRSLNTLCRKLAYSCNINNGGCCYISYLIAYHLDRLGIKYRLIIFSEDPKVLWGIREEVLRRHRNSSDNISITGSGTCAHYAIFLEGGGSVNAGSFKGYKHYFIESISSSDIKWIYRMGDWNSYYDTRNNKRVRKIFNTFFNGYEKRSNLSNHQDINMSQMQAEV